MSTYEKYRKNIYSQNGEDGVIDQLLLELNISRGSFVEFGAWDGKYLSNTYHLLESGWNGVYIEGDEKRFFDLQINTEIFKDRIELVNKFVSISGENCLDSILGDTNIPKNFDLLSIDIDSYDWQIWNSVINYYPKIVIIEINSNILPGVYQTHRNSIINGSSFSSMVELGYEKGYIPIIHTGNLIFIKNEFENMIMLTKDELNKPELLFDYSWVEASINEKNKLSLINRIINKLQVRAK